MNQRGPTLPLAVFRYLQASMRLPAIAARCVTALGVFLFSILVWYVAELVAYPEAIQQYNHEQICFAVLCIFLTVLSFGIGYHATCRTEAGETFDRIRKHTDSFTSNLQIPRRVWWMFLAFLAMGFAPLIWVAEGDVKAIFDDAFLARKRWTSLFQRGRYGDVRDAFLELQMFLHAANILACAMIFDLRDKFTYLQRAIGATLIVYLTARVLNDGARMNVVVVLTPLLAAIYWRIPQKRRSAFLLIGVPALATVGFLWAVATLVSRDEGRLDWNQVLDARYTGFEMTRELLFLTNHVPEESPYLWGETYFAQAINPIPRFLWPGKPKLDAGLQLAHLQGQLIDGEPRLTVAPGAIGEMYWNFGVPGILVLSGMAGAAACLWDKFGRRHENSLPHFLVFACGLGIIFASGRSFNMSNFYPLLALGLGLLIAKNS